MVNAWCRLLCNKTSFSLFKNVSIALIKYQKKSIWRFCHSEPVWWRLLMRMCCATFRFFVLRRALFGAGFRYRGNFVRRMYRSFEKFSSCRGCVYNGKQQGGVWIVRYESGTAGDGTAIRRYRRPVTQTCTVSANRLYTFSLLRFLFVQHLRLKRPSMALSYVISFLF